MAMISVFAVFALTTIICFAASLQANPITLGVIRSANRGLWSESWQRSLGSIIAEVLYAALAILAAEYFYKLFGQWKPMEFLGPLILTGFGVYLIFAANKRFIRGRTQVRERGSAFTNGFYSGLYNPQILLFYGGLLLAFYQFGIKPEMMLPRIVAFVSGAAMGLLLLLSLLIYIIRRRGEISSNFTGQRVMKIAGALLVLMGAYQFLSALQTL
jgi:threonine/homoserine/homoserine lactone efflux protein